MWINCDFNLYVELLASVRQVVFEGAFKVRCSLWSDYIHIAVRTTSRYIKLETQDKYIPFIFTIEIEAHIRKNKERNLCHRINVHECWPFVLSKRKKLKFYLIKRLFLIIVMWISQIKIRFQLANVKFYLKSKFFGKHVLKLLFCDSSNIFFVEKF